MGAALEAIGLEKVYGTATAVDGVDLDAQTGRVRLAVGPVRLRQDDLAAVYRRAGAT